MYYLIQEKKTKEMQQNGKETNGMVDVDCTRAKLYWVTMNL